VLTDVLEHFLRAPTTWSSSMAAHSAVHASNMCAPSPVTRVHEIKH